MCFAYEGEVIGIVIEHSTAKNQGVIHCSENDDDGKETMPLLENLGTPKP